ncbi:MAG: OprO/OprP family phosphate-selective porin [Flavobacterium sp.]|nr:OprO/OprP family phosphate-selective porin [Flavobacterium sp.]
MKLIRILTLVYSLLIVVYSAAQEITPNKYKFGEGFRFTGDGGYRMDISGFIQPSIETRGYTNDPNDSLYTRFRLRRARVQFSGESKDERLTYRLQLDLGGGGEADDNLSSLIFDAWAAYEISKNTKIAFGQKATPTDNRELGMRSNTLQLVERSPLSSAFATIREFGFFAETSVKLSKYQYLKPEIAVTNGDGINVFSKDRGGLKLGGRIDYLPFGLFSNFGQYRQVDIVRELTPKFVFGINYSYNQGISDRRGRESGTILYLDSNNQEALPDYVKFGADFLFKYQGFSVLGEFVNASSRFNSNITQRVRNNGTVTPDFDSKKIQDYVNDRMILGDAYNIQGGYVFKNNISIDGRFSHIKPAANSFLNNATFFNRSHFYTLGITKFLSRSYGAKIQMDCTYINAKSGSNGLNGSPLNGNEIIGRVMTTITF